VSDSKPRRPGNIQRRTFLERSAKLGAGALAAPVVFSNASQILGANDRIGMALIGAGGRGRGVMAMHQAHGADFRSVCDVYKPHLDNALKEAKGKAEPSSDYRQVLDQKNLDAVVIATPEHLHAPMLIDAVHAGKDVYCEKPMSHSIEEGVRMVREVRRSDRVVQIGMQRRSSSSLTRAKPWLKECGNVHMVKTYWNWDWSFPLDNSPLQAKVDWKAFLGPAPWHEFEPQRFRYWRYFWDFSGGNCTDQGTHLMDVVQWFLGVGPPRAAVCFGENYESTGAETPDVFSATFEYDGFVVNWSLCYTSSFENGWNIQFMGDLGTLVLHRGGARLLAPPSGTKRYDRRYGSEVVKEINEEVDDAEHAQNFLECCRSREQPTANVDVGHAAVCGPHLANLALHHKTRARLNANATKAYV
jgi:predicted dehydrogenase